MATHWLKRVFGLERATPGLPVAPGLYHMMEERGDSFARFHLRVDNDGSGMLIANAMAAAQLTPSGVVIAKGILENQPRDQILRTLKSNFSGADEARMRTDIAWVERLIERLKTPGDTYPVFNLEDAAVSPYSAQLMAPFQAAIPLAPPDTLVPLLDRLWNVGIPHVTLLAPPNPERMHLIRVVEHAEDLGLIAGVRALAHDISGDFLADLRQVGVDHITFPYAANTPTYHDAIYGEGDHDAADEVLGWLEEHQISAVAEIPLTTTTLDTLDATVDSLIARGADNLSFVAFATQDETLAHQDGVFTSDAMAQVATTVEEIANMAQARFMWSPPVERDPTLPLADQIVAGPRCSGDVSVRVEPSGEVIPPRGPYQSAGNLLRDSWDTIWQHEVFRHYRERVEAPTRCDVCPGLAICAADCPRDYHGWAQKA